MQTQLFRHRVPMPRGKRSTKICMYCGQKKWWGTFRLSGKSMLVEPHPDGRYVLRDGNLFNADDVVMADGEKRYRGHFAERCKK